MFLANKWTDEEAETVLGLSELGLDDLEISKKIGMHRSRVKSILSCETTIAFHPVKPYRCSTCSRMVTVKPCVACSVKQKS